MDPESRRTLDLKGEAETLATDLVEPGSTYNKLAMMHCFYGTWRKVVGYGSSVTIIVIRSLEEGAARSLGPLTDYIVVGAGDPARVDATTVAHELGHCCYLLHDGDSGNLMLGSAPRGTSLNWWQTTVVRSSRHVTYF